MCEKENGARASVYKKSGYIKAKKKKNIFKKVLPFSGAVCYTEHESVGVAPIAGSISAPRRAAPTPHRD